MTGQIFGPERRKELQAIISQLIGKQCWHAELSYGDELGLDLGQRLARNAGPLRGTTYGEYQLSVLVDDWTLVDSSNRRRASGTNLAVYEFDHSEASHARLHEYERVRAEVLAQLSEVVDRDVQAVEIDSPDLGLRVAFTNSWQLIVPCPLVADANDPQVDQDSDPMACWELYLPKGSLSNLVRPDSMPTWPLIKAMPGGRWTVTDWGGA